MDAESLSECGMPHGRTDGRRLKKAGCLVMLVAVFLVGCLLAAFRAHLHDIARADVQSHFGSEVRKVDWQPSWTHGYWIAFKCEEQMADGQRVPCYVYWYAHPWRKVMITHD